MSSLPTPRSFSECCKALSRSSYHVCSLNAAMLGGMTHDAHCQVDDTITQYQIEIVVAASTIVADVLSTEPAEVAVR